MGKNFSPPRMNVKLLMISGFAFLLIAGGFLLTQRFALASPTDAAQTESPFHPDIPLLDEDGKNVLDTGKPVSTINTCGSCHDTEFITNHSYHVDLGLNELTSPGTTATERPWDISPGPFGSWNSIEYRYLSPQGDEHVDLTTPDWIRLYGLRHVGGGPAMYARNGELLTELSYSAGSLETNTLNPETRGLERWNWDESGIVEMNCFLCHTPIPNNDARAEALSSGDFQWANTATLLGSEIVTWSGNEYSYNPAVFTDDRTVDPDVLKIQDPSNANCGLCHGLVHDNVEDPLITLGCSPERWSTITTGQIISPQKMSDSGMNLADKQTLTRSWDVHAERLLNCVDCHYSLNNPLFYQENQETKPDHLLFDPRRLEIGEYLEKPIHQFAKGNNAQSNLAPELDDTMRTCQSCHAAEKTHDWLPYLESHLNALSCESCHIPQLYSSANMVHDWTVLLPDQTARKECRGTEGDVNTMETLLVGYQPALIPSPSAGGQMKLAPHNLITTWYWAYGDPARPVPLADLQAAYFEDGDYHPGILIRFDADQDGELTSQELVIDTAAKEEFVRDRLVRLGFSDPEIVGEIQPYSINHDVASAKWAMDDCTACHGQKSRVTQPILLALSAPGGAEPEFVPGTGRELSGEIQSSADGALYYYPAQAAQELYVFGHNRLAWLDWVGLGLFGSVAVGVIAHGGLRLYFSSRRKEEQKQTERVYVYGAYERLWHWMQTAAIILLLLTGLVIHRPDTFSFMNFRNMVRVHNVVAALLAINAFLSLFYHLASGQIRQYIPRPKGFFDRTFEQALYYLKGIFQGDPHPFEKSPDKKLNPLQQVTYFGLLNVLLPLQGITGILMWGVQRWPDLSGALGGLPTLAPIHTILAWLFASFIVLHVYLTTTGHTAVSSIEAMITGWEELEKH